MKLFNAKQIADWDAYTLQQEPVSSLQLMERAALACVDWLLSNSYLSHSIQIFCGKGNNGGDGLAIARLLIERGFQPQTFILEFGKIGSDDFQQNLQKLHALTADIHFIQSESFFPAISKENLVIDALFGTGLNRPLTGVTAALVEHINDSSATVISIDLPSGMMIDQSCKDFRVIQSKHTLTFQSLKPCFLMAENATSFGEVAVLNIGLHPAYPPTIETVLETISPGAVHQYFQPRNNFSHKGTHGHSLLMAGNNGKAGAAVLATKACLRSGTGLATVNIPSRLAAVIHAAIPEAMVMNREDAFEEWEKFTSIGVGPGFGTDEKELTLLKNAFKQFPRPMVVDADALTLIANQKIALTSLPAGSILTPHPREFDRLVGVSANDFERAEKALSLTRSFPLVMVLKGHHTLVAYQGKGWYNLTGNAGLAKGGSGDVLTGILTALLAQKYPPFHAAIIGVYLHGLAADFSLETQTMETVLASDIIEYLPKAFTAIQQSPG